MTLPVLLTLLLSCWLLASSVRFCGVTCSVVPVSDLLFSLSVCVSFGVVRGTVGENTTLS